MEIFIAAPVPLGLWLADIVLTESEPARRAAERKRLEELYRLPES
jgi:hypothetical protein